jgi:hypothetical protein
LDLVRWRGVLAWGRVEEEEEVNLAARAHDSPGASSWARPAWGRRRTAWGHNDCFGACVLGTRAKAFSAEEPHQRNIDR